MATVCLIVMTRTNLGQLVALLKKPSAIDLCTNSPTKTPRTTQPFTLSARVLESKRISPKDEVLTLMREQLGLLPSDLIPDWNATTKQEPLFALLSNDSVDGEPIKNYGILVPNTALSKIRVDLSFGSLFMAEEDGCPWGVSSFFTDSKGQLSCDMTGVNAVIEAFKYFEHKGY